MPVSIGGVASGMDTDAIITKLMEVEARPIKNSNMKLLRAMTGRRPLVSLMTA